MRNLIFNQDNPFWAIWSMAFRLLNSTSLWDSRAGGLRQVEVGSASGVASTKGVVSVTRELPTEGGVACDTTGKSGRLA